MRQPAAMLYDGHEPGRAVLAPARPLAKAGRLMTAVSAAPTPFEDTPRRFDKPESARRVPAFIQLDCPQARP